MELFILKINIILQNKLFKINKIIYYIDNNFKLELKMKEFYDSFEFKCRNNTQLFIEYIQNMV